MSEPLQLEPHREVGGHIRARRRALGLTLEGLEAASGVGAAFIGQIERGVKIPSLATLARVAKGLGVTLAQLLGEPPGEAGEPDAALERRIVALLRGHGRHERAFLLASLRDLSRRLRGIRPPARRRAMMELRGTDERHHRSERGGA